MKVFHIITGLDTGGAETMLYKLLSNTDRNSFDSEVISLTDIGPIGEEIQALGIPVIALKMKRGVPDPRFVIKLARFLKRRKPDIVQTWLYHADLIGGVAARAAGTIPTVWGIHQSNLDPAVNKRMTLWTARVCAKLSGIIPQKIVCCSEASRRAHSEYGYVEDKMQVITNGFDLEVFKPDHKASASVRAELGLAAEDIIVGNVARYDPQKDHANLIDAASIIHRSHANVHFVLCGDGVTWDNQELSVRITDSGLEQVFHLLGRRGDIARITAAFNIACLSSCGEGFPNVIGEAMACEVPCVVTDAGDSASIIGDTGLVVPLCDPEKLAEGLIKMIEMGKEQRQQLGMAARQRVFTYYRIEHIVNQYEDLYRYILKEQRERGTLLKTG